VVAVLMLRRRTNGTKLLTIFLVALGLGALGRTLTIYVLWGGLVTTPHAAFGAAVGAGQFLREVFVRGTGLLFDREYGLLAYGPLYVLAGPGLVALSRYDRRLARDVLVVLACYLIPVLMPVTNVHGWTGGWSPAARFLVPVAPLLWLGVYKYAAQAAPAGTAVVAALVVLQLAIDAFVWQFPKTLWNDGAGVSAFRWSQWLPTWTDSRATLAFAGALGTAFAFGYLCSRFGVAGPANRSDKSLAAPSLPPA
jgi:hypothetical protein